MKVLWFATITNVFLLLCTNGLQAQETVASTGGNATGSGGNVSYTVGQISYTSITATAGTITQGVQQPYEIFEVESVIENDGITLEMVVYPNPTSDFIKLKIEDYKLEGFIYQLYDINGKLLLESEIIDKETVIQTGDLNPSEYFLKVTGNNKELKTFKIVKN